MAQLPLALKLQPFAALESFVAGANVAAVEHIRAVARRDRLESVWLWGPPSTGKSHLLAAACRVADEAGLRAICLSLASAQDPDMLKRLEGIDLVALDDVDHAAGDPGQEAGLFALFDARLQTGGLVVAAGAAPRDCHFLLSDLTSRAGAAAVYRLEFLGDEDLKEAVTRHATMRGLSLEPAALSYLLQRFSRDLGELTTCLDRIDSYSLATQRKITIPLLREVLAA